MDIHIQADGISLGESLRAAVDEKIGRLEQYATRAVRARVILRKASAHPSARQFAVRVLIELPGQDASAEETGPDMLSAIDLVTEKLEGQLRKRKTKRLATRERSPRIREKA